MNPLKAMGSAIISVPDTLLDGFSKMINRRQSTDRSDVTASTNGSVATPGYLGPRGSILSDSYTSNLAILDQVSSLFSYVLLIRSSVIIVQEIVLLALFLFLDGLR